MSFHFLYFGHVFALYVSSVSLPLHNQCCIGHHSILETPNSDCCLKLEVPSYSSCLWADFLFMSSQTRVTLAKVFMSSYIKKKILSSSFRNSSQDWFKARLFTMKGQNKLRSTTSSTLVSPPSTWRTRYHLTYILMDSL